MTLILNGSIFNDILDSTGFCEVYGLGGDDEIQARAHLSSGDILDGGLGSDTLRISGFDLDFRLITLAGFEELSLSTTITQLSVYQLLNFNAVSAFGDGYLEIELDTLPDADFSSVTMLTDTVHVNITGNSLDNVIHMLSGPNIGFTSILGLGGDDTLYGGDGNDKLFGGDDNDILYGGDGQDILYGGTGKNIINGGAGNDTININGDVALTIANGYFDTVDGGTQTGADKITYTQFAAAVYIQVTGNTAVVSSSGDHDIFTGPLQIITNTTGIEEYIGSDFADRLEGHDGINNVLRGGGDDDVIFGGNSLGQFDNLFGDDGNDVIYGLDGLDNLLGGDGQDELRGGNGDDTIYGDGDFTSFNFLFPQFHSPNVTIGDADTIFGGSGNDQIFGAGGDDIIDDSSGGATIYGGLGNDTITISSPGVGFSVLFGNDGDDNITGSNSDDAISGGAGADTIDGGGGTDELTYFDFWMENTTGVIVSLATGIGTGGDALGDIISNIENLTGSRYDDILTGDGGVNIIEGGEGDDTINGGGGDDTLRGGDGADILDGGAGIDIFNGGAGNDTIIGSLDVEFVSGGDDTDTVDYAGATNTQKINLITNINTGGFAHNDTLISIENVIGSDTRGDDITGTAGANVLWGMGADDYLRGYHGDDALYGGDNNDFLYGGTGGDALSGGNGLDWAMYNGLTAGVTVNLLSGFGSGGQAAGDIYSNIERVRGSLADDTITGTNGINKLLGDGGNDTINGMGGKDVIRGGDGDDIINGGTGNDGMRGDAGSDTFIFELGSGHDFVIDFEDGIDTLNIDDALYGGGLTIEELVDDHMIMENANRFHFDFGNGDVLHVLTTSAMALTDFYDDVVIV